MARGEGEGEWGGEDGGAGVAARKVFDGFLVGGVGFRVADFVAGIGSLEVSG